MRGSRESPKLPSNVAQVVRAECAGLGVASELSLAEADPIRGSEKKHIRVEVRKANRSGGYPDRRSCRAIDVVQWVSGLIPRAGIYGFSFTGSKFAIGNRLVSHSPESL